MSGGVCLEAVTSPFLLTVRKDYAEVLRQTGVHEEEMHANPYPDSSPFLASGRHPLGRSEPCPEPAPKALSTGAPERKHVRSVRAWIRRAVDGLIHLHGSPEEVAWGLAVGLFVAMTPTIGLQMVMAVFLAGLLRVNSAAAAAGVWVTNPLTAPFFYSITYYVGAKILGHQASVVAHHGVDLRVLWEAGSHVFWACMVGGGVVGLALALISYYPTVYLVQAGRAALQRRSAGRRRRKSRRR